MDETQQQSPRIDADRAEPDSERWTAVRRLIAIVEQQSRRRVSARAQEANKLSQRLRVAIGDLMAEAITVENIGPTRAAPDAGSDRPSGVGTVISRLEDLGERITLDVRRLGRLVDAAEQVKRVRGRLDETLQGAGPAGYSLVFAGETASNWVTGFSRNPFQALFSIDPTGCGCELATDIARGLTARWLEEMRAIRLAERILRLGTGPSAKEPQLDSLTSSDLTSEERALCPPLLLVCAPDALSGSGFEQLNQLLSSDLFIKVALVEDDASPCAETEIAVGQDRSLFAAAPGRTIVTTDSTMDADHLSEAVRDALEMPGPALIRIGQSGSGTESEPRHDSREKQ